MYVFTIFSFVETINAEYVNTNSSIAFQLFGSNEHTERNDLAFDLSIFTHV